MTIKGYLKKKFAEQKEVWREEREFQKKLAKKRKAAYRETLLKERARIAAEGVKVEAEVRLRRYKERIGYTQIAPTTPSVQKIVKKIRGKKGKRKKILKKMIKARAPTISKPKTDYDFYDDISRGLPA